MTSKRYAFADRHIGINESELREMLRYLGYDSLDQLTTAVVPKSIVDDADLSLKVACSEETALDELIQLANKNVVAKSLIGQGYYNTFTPAVLQRNVLENPAWYTAYTPYQPEISQGRLEVLFYFQTMVTELTGLDIANASLLDEATAAAEAMTLAHRALRGKRQICWVSSACHPQTLALLNTRSAPLGIELRIFNDEEQITELDEAFAVFVQYPDTYGVINDYKQLAERTHQHGALFITATDLLALTLLKTPASFGADIAVGSAQRFGVPLGFGGPHAGFMAVTDKYKRLMPGRLVGESIDSLGNPAFRLALQTREQHIRREKATSNICTAQALLAIMATLYACYHGPKQLQLIAQHVHRCASRCALSLKKAGIHVRDNWFDTITVEGDNAAQLADAAKKNGYNLNLRNDRTISIAFDETSTDVDVENVLRIFAVDVAQTMDSMSLHQDQLRTDDYMTQAVFNDFHSETRMMRYLKRLADKDIALDRSMIPLGSCTMKLNSAAEMEPISWPQFAQMHPFAPTEQTIGYRQMIDQLEEMLCACTGYDAVSLQPNAGSQGEYGGLLAIKAFHEANGDTERNICLIPQSAHGTNPASAQLANLIVVGVACDDAGNIDLNDLKDKLETHSSKVAAIMITYPSTHGVFEDHVTEVCSAVHQHGGQVYIDGANLNALVGLAQPGKFGGDVSHLNLHKTFCIPHGGGGPGVGPLAVREHLKPFLPVDGHNGERQGGQISATAFGSASILPISWMYIRMMGGDGMRQATQIAILNANYIAQRLHKHYPILYTGNEGLVAHECIIDTRPMKADGVTVDDIAKRLIDYGFHAPTMSFPVPGTLMIEPTESESFAEIERFCRAMICIHAEYMEVKNGIMTLDESPLRNAPHTLHALIDGDINRSYDLSKACTPDPDSGYEHKYWPPVARIDNVYGDKNLICSCPPMSAYES